MGFYEETRVQDVATVVLTPVVREPVPADPPTPPPAPVPPPTPTQDAQDATVETTGADPPPEA